MTTPPMPPLSAATALTSPDIRLVDIASFSDRIVEEVLLRLESHAPCDPDALARHLREALDETLAHPRVVQTARPYEGLRKDGNPIAYLFREYGILMNTGKFYQADLARRDKRLYQALCNAFRSREWRKSLGEAACRLRDMGLTVAIGPQGEPLELARELRDILAPRRNIADQPTKAAARIV